MEPSHFTLSIATDNAAFTDEQSGKAEPGPEIARILRSAADRIENGADVLTLRDVNGNTVGRAGFGK